MLKRQTIAVALCGVAPLGGCVEVRSNVSPIVVNVKSDGGQCHVSVARDPFVQPFVRVDQAQLQQIGRQAKGRRAIVVSDVSAQYKCLGAAIVTLQEAGLQVDVAPWDSR